MKFEGRLRFLSNFYPAWVHYDGVVYGTCEHAYQAAKTSDPEWKRYIQNAPSPAQAKERGRLCPARDDWDDVKVQVMRDILADKFRLPALHNQLMELKGTSIEETNHWHDKFWGVCTCSRCDGQGENWLGKLLMELRDSQ